MDLVNIVQERLCPEGEWPFLFARLKFRQYEGILALPSEYETLIRADLDREHLRMQDAWFEFVHDGPGQQDVPYRMPGIAIDSGESCVVRQPGSTAHAVRVYAYRDERVNGVRPYVRVFGYDEYNVWVRSKVGDEWVDGIDLPLNGDTNPNYATSTIKFSRVTQILKPRTVGDLLMVYVDTAGTESFAGRYSHRDTSPSFRIYRLPGILDGDTKLVHALVKKRVRPIQCGSDELLVTNLSALRFGLMALAAEDKGDIQGSLGFLASAVDVLRKETRAYRTGVMPVIETIPGAGFGGQDINIY